MLFDKAVLWSCAACLVPLVQADVEFTQPTAGEVIAGTSLAAVWTESGQRPAISTFESYQLFLCAGGNNDTNFVPVFNLQPYATYSEGNKWTGAVSPGWGANTTDAYFLKMISTSACGGTIINYSRRFTISSMSGSFPANVVAGVETIDGSTEGPSTDQSDAGAALACTASAVAEPVATSSASSNIAVSSSHSSSTSVAAGGSSSSSSVKSSKSITLSSGGLAGIIVTSMMIFAAISGVTIFIFLRLRKRRMQPQSPKSSFKLWATRNKEMERLDSRDHLAELSETAVCKELGGDKTQPTELSTVVRVELPARRSIYEMPGSLQEPHNHIQTTTILSPRALLPGRLSSFMTSIGDAEVDEAITKSRLERIVGCKK